MGMKTAFHLQNTCWKRTTVQLGLWMHTSQKKISLVWLQTGIWNTFLIHWGIFQDSLQPFIFPLKPYINTACDSNFFTHILKDNSRYTELPECNMNTDILPKPFTVFLILLYSLHVFTYVGMEASWFKDC